MNQSKEEYNVTLQEVLEDMQSQPHLMLRLQENALLVAESLRDNYFKNTAAFIRDLRQILIDFRIGNQSGEDKVLEIYPIDDLGWFDIRGEVVTSIDGGVGQIEMTEPVPIFLRVGSYQVKTGETNLSERENFAYYPVILGDLEGGSKERKDYVDIVRIIAELLGGLSALKRNTDLKVLMFHGPLMYLMNAYAGHTPFTEQDIDIFLRQYADTPQLAKQLKEDFLEAAIDIYPRLVPNSADEWLEKKVFEPLSLIAFLYNQLIQEAKSKQRKIKPIIAGAVERGQLKEFSRDLLFKFFQNMRKNKKSNYFNKLYGRQDLTSPEAVLDKLGYTDSLLLSMILENRQYSEPWIINKYGNLGKGKICLPGNSNKIDADWSCLKPTSKCKVKFPNIKGCYIKVSDISEPIRVEVIDTLGQDQLAEAVKRVYLYSSLLPGYGFPIGLDIVDKYAKIPNWMTNAYTKMIQYNLGVSLQKGEITDAEMRHLIVQSIYMQKRDFLFRPKI